MSEISIGRLLSLICIYYRAYNLSVSAGTVLFNGGNVYSLADASEKLEQQEHQERAPAIITKKPVNYVTESSAVYKGQALGQ
ncbi:MAG: hypothetical protein FIB08_04005 [Candidatus Methanoperedens sp.]|nr:hypothetical protein [Candidatus Methanoperedens sp.]